MQRDIWILVNHKSSREIISGSAWDHAEPHLVEIGNTI